MGTESLERLGESVNEALTQAVPSDVAARAGRAAFLMQVHQPVRRSSVFAWTAAGALLGVLVLAGLWMRNTRHSPEFVAGEEPGELGALLETHLNVLPLSFSEGSHIAVEPRSQLRVAEFGKGKARVQLQRGQATLSIQKGKGRLWAVEAGPFAVNVTGTRFSVDWQPERQRLEVVLIEGSVVVTGPCLKGAQRMAAPQRLVAACNEAPLAFEGTSVPNAAPLPQPPQAEQMAPTPKRGVVADNLWWQLAKAGRYQEALVRAKALGFASLCRSVSPAELLDLADAARFAGDALAAEHALAALTKRFPHSPQGALASFHLGRIAFDGKQDYEIAATHFARYLAKNPQGALVGDAWGRLLQARERVAHKDASTESAAKQDARAYLDRYPHGPFAGLAKRLLGP